MTDSTIDHFKCDVRRFDTLDTEIKTITDKIKPLQTRLKELKETKKTLESTICSFMETNEIAECKLSEGALLFKESKNVIPLSKESIRQNIIKFFQENYNDEFKKLNSEEKAEKLFKFVYENREYKENKVLKRV
jgi:phosphoenolpyruvate carboxylase